MIKQFKKTINDMDKPLLLVTIIFVIVGLLNIVNASSREAATQNNTLYYYFLRQLIMIIISIIGSIIIIKTPSKKYLIWTLLGFVAVFVMSVILLYTESYRGAQNWLPIMGQAIQPSEFAKPIIIVLLAFIFEKNFKALNDPKANHSKIIGIILIAGLLIPALVFLQKDLGTMFITTCVVMIMFMCSPVPFKDRLKTYLILFICVVVGCLGLLATKGYILSSEQLDRMKEYWYPCSNYENGGYQVCNSFIAINDGGLFGLGIGKSKQKYSYIPEPHTDSVFAIVAEEYGFIKSSFVFLGYAIILKRILDLASKANTLRGRYICIGAAAYIFMHIFVNLGGLFGLIPLTGVPLPFLSYGGSFFVSSMCMLAIVQRIHIETKNQKLKIGR